MVKLNTASVEVQEFVTLALVPGCPVVVVPTLIVPVSHLSPLGIVKFNIA